VPSLVRFWRRSRKCKRLQTDGQTDGRRTTGDQKSSLELSAQVNEKLCWVTKENKLIHKFVQKSLFEKKRSNGIKT
jgi:hypothetical protein